MTTGKELEFGVFPEPLADPPERVERLVRATEWAGFGGHSGPPYQRRFYDTWTLIAYLATRTRWEPRPSAPGLGGFSWESCCYSEWQLKPKEQGRPNGGV